VSIFEHDVASASMPVGAMSAERSETPGGSCVPLEKDDCLGACISLGLVQKVGVENIAALST
jgi:hypothetical protein